VKPPFLPLILACLAGGCVCTFADWRLVWNDEFNGAAVDATRWTYDLGTGPPYPGWGNNELECYTSRRQNVFVANGLLHIVARIENYGGADYTSARLKTQGRFSKTYGRFEFRARLPQGRGYWPAFWLMPRDSVYGTWAASGEVDIMENQGQNPATIFGTIHFGGQWPANTQSYGPSFTFPAGHSATNFHIYALEWRTNSFRWYVDGRLYQTQASWWSSGGSFPAPFDQPFYIVMNLAVGGNFAGPPDASTVFPGEIQIDYVRVYDYSAAPVPRPQFTCLRCEGSSVVMAGTNGPPLGTFHLLATADPAAPLTQWAPVFTNQFDAAGTFSQSMPPSSSRMFYRIEVP